MLVHHPHRFPYGTPHVVHLQALALLDPQPAMGQIQDSPARPLHLVGRRVVSMIATAQAFSLDLLLGTT